MRLLLDLGNTRVKWAWQARSADWLAAGAVDWREDVGRALEAAWADMPGPIRVIGASVVDASREEQVAALVRRLSGLAIRWLRTPAQACGVRNAYAEPQRLGVDRFLVMVAAHAAGFAPCVLAGVGTALTLDALAADGQHLGGLIAPGPQLMQQSLLDATARVRPEHPGAIVELADNTADAVASGCWQAAAALVERFASRTASRLGTVPELILGGGDAPALLPLLSLPARLSQDAVLRGLAIWADTQ
ncbi:type III pantothenate kinase [Rhodanobacter ginsengiterrae]|uniref:type III pantothenate kinase n=1 Tax=Rhodanobacter ginsengiterrae TaxID=2008451 RepID=UPI003CF02A3D